MSLKTIGLSIIILSLMACGSKTPPPATTGDSAKPPATAPAKSDATPGGTSAPVNALEKAKGVEGVVDKKAEDTSKAVEKDQ